MAVERQQTIVRMPTDAETKRAFEEYSLAVGKVSHAWNYLQERLGLLFRLVSGAPHEIASAVWYSVESDRSQRNMLSAAAGANTKLSEKYPDLVPDLKWLVDRCGELSQRRNDAIHAPCSLYIHGEKGAEVGSFFLFGHPRAKNLKGKKLLTEFAW